MFIRAYSYNDCGGGERCVMGENISHLRSEYGAYKEGACHGKRLKKDEECKILRPFLSVGTVFC